MDIYPVPDCNGHSNLPNQTISCVGDYVDVLCDQVVSSGLAQRKPIWMVLQAMSWVPATSIELHWYNGSTYISRDCYQPAVAGNWQQIADARIHPPAGATGVDVLCRTYAPGTYYFDDVTLSTGGTNMLSNSSMETDSPVGWNKSGGSGVTQIWDSDSYHSPSHALKTVVSDPMQVWASNWDQHVSIDPTKTYSLSAWVNASSVGTPIPTWTQTRFMSYDAVIHGAAGWHTMVFISQLPTRRGPAHRSVCGRILSTSPWS